MQKSYSTPSKNETTFDKGNKTKHNAQNIKVLVRVRPVLKSEFGKEVAVDCENNKKTVTLNTKSNIIQSTLDGAYNETVSQQEIFEQIQSYIPAILQGFNCTIFAYGQTGSGKTHTMFGSDWESIMFKDHSNLTNIQSTYVGDINEDRNFSGLIPRAINKLFNEINMEENKPQNFAVYCSFLQIYNEKVFDLLNDKASLASLNIRENKIDGIYVEGLSEYCVSNFQECLVLMQRGEKNRFIRHTSNNVKSSRSHTIFQLVVESTKADASGKLQKAKLHLCDLAGSEKLKKSEDIGGAHLTELKNINLSLTTLGKVIHNLSLGSKLPIPYRESKLTRLLQDSLGGNTKTCLIATINPLLEYVDESLNTLKFAERAKHIVTEVKANKIEAIDDELVKKLQKEISYLKEILNIRRKGTSAINQVHNKLLILQEENDRLRQHHVSVDEVEKLMAENRKMRMELQQLKLESQSDRDDNLLDALDKEAGTPLLKEIGTPVHTKGFLSDKIERLDTNNENEKGLNIYIPPSHESTGQLKSSRFSHPASRQNNTYKLQNSIEGANSPTNYTNSLRLTGKLISSQTPSTKDASFTTGEHLSLPVRVKGKGAYEGTVELGKHPKDIKKMEEIKKEQQRALRRLQDLEDFQRKSRQKETSLGTTKSSKFMELPPKSDPNSYPSVQTEKAGTKNYNFADFDKMYNPYKVRQEIEKKYHSQTRASVGVNKSVTRNADQSVRLKNIERNYIS